VTEVHAPKKPREGRETARGVNIKAPEQ